MKKFSFDISFLIFLIMLFFSPKQQAVIWVILALIIHECGHLVAVWFLDFKIAKMKISGFGFMLELLKSRPCIKKELILYGAGVLANALSLLLPLNTEYKSAAVFLIVINLLPIYPLDGHNFLKSLLAYFFPYFYVLIFCFGLGFMMSLGIVVYGVIKGIDLYLIVAFSYLAIFNAYEIFSCHEVYSLFLADKMIYNYKLPIRTIKFHTNYLRHLYRYQEVKIILNERIITESELLQKIP